MKFPCVIEPKKGKAGYGVIFPDLTGCYANGETLDKAIQNATEAAGIWIEEELEDGRNIPTPSSFEEISKNKEWEKWIFSYVEVDMAKISGKAIRLNICLPSRVVRRLDTLAASYGESRSSFIARLALEAR